MTKATWVTAKELAHLVVPIRYHLWQSIDGINKSLTNTPALKGLESKRWLDFDTEYYWVLTAQLHPHPTLKNAPVNGFYFVDHLLKLGNVVEGEVWDERVESYLISRGVVVHKASVSQSRKSSAIMKFLAEG